MPVKEKLSLYIHIPFCRSRCNYCDFNTYAGMESYIQDYVAALVKEIGLASPALKSEFVVHSIYFGGGTPTILPVDAFRKIIQEVRSAYDFTEDVEITTEANPLHLPADYLCELKSLGINRLSMGMQSANADELRVLGRQHSLDDVAQSMDNARIAEISNVNLDLIFGIPGQSLRSFQDSITQSLAFAPQHLSVYSLTVEEGTPLERMLRAGNLTPIDEDTSADMYEWVMGYLPEQGFQQYEISNWAAGEAYRSSHNLQYWHYRPYLGFGAGAHSYFNHQRWANVATIQGYLKKMDRVEVWQKGKPPASAENIRLKEKDEIQEFMMMGLRLVDEGIAEEEFKARFARDLNEVYGKEITFLVENGLLERLIQSGRHVIRLTTRGRMLGNQVFMQFMQV
jgi:oxygen-independent coproporphyrinogen III oxidase